MASGFKRTSKKSHGGSITTVTQKKGGGTKRTISQSLGSSGNRVAYTQAANGDTIRTTTSKSLDGFVTRKQQTVVKVGTSKTVPAPQPYKAKVAKINVSKSTHKVAKPHRYKSVKALKFNSKPSKVELYLIAVIFLFGLVGAAFS
jgi:hypothetical protein